MAANGEKPVAIDKRMSSMSFSRMLSRTRRCPNS
jgi:hypothetical protein